MERQQRLPDVSEATVMRLIAEKTGHEDKLEQGLQLNLGLIFSEVLQTGRSVQLDQLEESVRKMREEWLTIFSIEQPALARYVERLSPDKMTDIFRTILARTDMDTESVTFFARNLGKIAGEQILDIAHMVYEGLHAEMEGQSLSQLLDRP